MKYAINAMDRYGLGVILISDINNKLEGIITDGDLRRLIVQEKLIFRLSIEDVMSQNPYKINLQSTAYDALNIMEEHQITVLPVTNIQNKILGIVHLHDILGKGAFRFNKI